MNTLISRSPVMALALALAILCPTRLTQAAPAKPADAPTPSPKAPPAAEMQTPQSVFVQGQDPFFPPRMPPPGPKPPPNDDTVASGIVLNGMSGTSDQRLVIINNRTFATGEEGVIKITGGDTVRIKCKAIRDASVEILIRGRLRKELSLPSGR